MVMARLGKINCCWIQYRLHHRLIMTTDLAAVIALRAYRIHLNFHQHISVHEAADDHHCSGSADLRFFIAWTEGLA